MGFAPIKWTCTAFFRPRQLTDRAILAKRQTQEKKSLRFLTVSVVGTMEEWDRYRLGHRAVGVLAGTPWPNVQSGHSKALIQGSSCAALGPHPEKGEDIR